MTGGRKRQTGRRTRRPTAAEKRRAAEAQAPLEPLVEDKAKGLRIKYRRVAELIPYARNARTHSDAQVAQIAASIREFGFTNPVGLNGEDGILAGHGRVMAAALLKLDKVPCVDLAHLTEAQRRAYVVADNRIAEGASWNNELLAVEIGELEAQAFDIRLLGFAEAELDELMGRGVEPPAEGEDAAEPGRKHKRFALTEAQAATVDAAIKLAKESHAAVAGAKENATGVALAFICERFMAGRAK